MVMQVIREHFGRLVDNLRQTLDFANVRDRRPLVETPLVGFGNGCDSISQLDLMGNSTKPLRSSEDSRHPVMWPMVRGEWGIIEFYPAVSRPRGR